MKKGRQDRIAETLTSFSANSKGEEALLHLQNTYSQVIPVSYTHLTLPTT